MWESTVSPLARVGDEINIIGNSHSKLSNSCIQYLRINESPLSKITIPEDIWTDEVKENSRRRITGFPFLDYAVRSLFVHAKKAESWGIIQEDIVQLLGGPRELFEAWIKTYITINQSDPNGPRPGETFFHQAVSANIISVVCLLLENGSTLR